MYVKDVYGDMWVEALFEAQLEQKISVNSQLLKWKYYNEMKESWNFMLICNNMS